jgi:hypothetical protein
MYRFWAGPEMPNGLENHFELLLELGVIEKDEFNEYFMRGKLVAFHDSDNIIVLLPRLVEFL